MTCLPENHDPEELAALYWSGAASDEERAAVEDRLDAGRDERGPAADSHLRDALARLAPATDALLESVEPLAPPPELRARILAAAADSPASAPSNAGTIWSRWAGDGDDAVLRRGRDGEWLATGVDGVTVRRLFVDRANDRMTAVFRMAPGTSYPGHRHHGPEECLVLEGSFRVDGQSMRAGDYLRRPAGSLHGVTRTEEGCLLLITSSLHDEHLPAG